MLGRLVHAPAGRARRPWGTLPLPYRKVAPVPGNHETRHRGPVASLRLAQPAGIDTLFNLWRRTSPVPTLSRACSCVVDPRFESGNYIDRAAKQSGYIVAGARDVFDGIQMDETAFLVTEGIALGKETVVRVASEQVPR